MLVVRLGFGPTSRTGEAVVDEPGNQDSASGGESDISVRFTSPLLTGAERCDGAPNEVQKHDCKFLGC